MYQQHPRYREAGTSLIEVMITAVIFAVAMVGLGKLIVYGYQDNIRQSQFQSDIFSNYTTFLDQTGSFTDVTVPVTVSTAANSSAIAVTISTVSGNTTNDNVYQTEPSA